MSIRELAEKHYAHRRTVRQALASAVPPPRKAYPRRPRPAVDAHAETIDSWLLADRDVPVKQRHTARRIWQRPALGGQHDHERGQRQRVKGDRQADEHKTQHHGRFFLSPLPE